MTCATRRRPQDLTLRTPADVAPGDYSSILTLSLFEG